MKVKVYQGQPIFMVVDEHWGVCRNRYPDNGWGEIHKVNMVLVMLSEVDLSDDSIEAIKLKQALHEDLAYYFGQDSARFTEKLQEFGFVDPELDFSRK